MAWDVFISTEAWTHNENSKINFINKTEKGGRNFSSQVRVDVERTKKNSVLDGEKAFKCLISCFLNN